MPWATLFRIALPLGAALEGEPDGEGTTYQPLCISLPESSCTGIKRLLPFPSPEQHKMSMRDVALKVRT